jgi:sulfide:quinone oxidoreductase
MHYYQPMWTMVAGHLGFKAEDSERPMGDIIPKGAEWHRDSVAAFHPEDNKVKLASGKEVCSFLPP